MQGPAPEGRFPKAERVRKRLEFLIAQEAGRRATTPHFILLLFARGETGAARLGIVASRKVGPAVVRNRAKRLVRQAFRATRDLWMPGIDLVVIVRRSLEDMKLEHVTREWRAVSSLVHKRSLEARRDHTQRAAEPSEASAP